MIQTDITIDRKDAKRLRDLARRFPRDTYKGIGRAGSTVRARLRKVMKNEGGIHGVKAFAPHEDATIHLMNNRGRSDRRIGGKLADPSSIQMFKRRGAFTVGFVDGLEGYAKSFQTADNRQLSRSERFWFLRHDVDRREYRREARNVVDPFAREAKDDMLKWAVRNTEKILEKAGQRI